MYSLYKIIHLAPGGPPVHNRQIDASLLRKAVRSGGPKVLGRVVDKLTQEEIAPLLIDLSPAELKIVLTQLSNRSRLGKVLLAVPAELLSEVVRNCDSTEFVKLASLLDYDEAPRIFSRFDEALREDLLARIDPALSKQITRLLRYPATSAAGRMVPRFAAVDPSATVGEAIRHIRQAGDDVPLFYLYVCEWDGTLDGVISLSQLVKASDETLVRDIMVTDLVSVPPEAHQEEVAHVVSRRNLLAIPVVQDNKMLGVVTIDHVIEVLEQEATEDMYNMAGLSEGDRVFSPARRSIVKRLPWNLLNLLTSLTAAWVVSQFEHTIAKVVALATFMPVVAGIGGNTGNQTLTVILRGLTLGELEFSSGLRALFKELLVALSVGALLGTALALLCVFWRGDPMLGLVLGLAMILNLTVAALVGTAIPLTLKRIGLDPALGASILVTTFTDICGFLAFLGLATLMMR